MHLNRIDEIQRPFTGLARWQYLFPDVGFNYNWKTTANFYPRFAVMRDTDTLPSNVKNLVRLPQTPSPLLADTPAKLRSIRPTPLRTGSLESRARNVFAGVFYA